ncbi:MAG TPA: hypothetical protein VKY22_11815 [Bradyrhizobium sp.]|nr:hypothetical protein [Bradyrhizobium sp.]
MSGNNTRARPSLAKNPVLSSFFNTLLRLVMRIGPYRWALLFMAAICLIHLTVALYVVLVQHGTAVSTFFRLGVSSAVLFGIWVQSNLARLVGGLWLLVLLFCFLTPLIFWPTVSDLGRASPLFEALYVLGLLLCAPCYWLLLCSRDFEKEYCELRQTQPAYKTSLKEWAEQGLFVAFGMFLLHKLFG